MRRILFLLLLLVGCATQPVKRVEITYQTTEALDRQIVAAFEQTHPEIHVNTAGNTASDVFDCDVDKLPELARRGAVSDLPADFAPATNGFSSEVVEACRVNGKLLMLPVRFSTDVLLYNRDWFEKAGEPVPDESWDWQKFGDVAERLAKQRDLNYATVLPRPLLLMQSFGTTLFADGKCKIDSPEAVAGLEFYRWLAIRGAPTSDGVDLFRAQKIAMFVGRTEMLTEFDKITDFRWDVAPVPKGKVRWSRLSVAGICVSSGTKHPREAWEFAKFVSTKGARLAVKLPPVAREALADSHLDNPWGFAGWDEFYRRAFVVLPEGIVLGHIEPDEAALLMQGQGEELLTGN